MEVELRTIHLNGDIVGHTPFGSYDDYHILQNILGCPRCDVGGRGGNEYEFRVISVDPESGEIQVHCNALFNFPEKASCLERNPQAVVSD